LPPADRPNAALPDRSALTITVHVSAVDVQTRQVLWSFTYPTEEAWSFGIPVAADSAIYVGTYQTLLKLK